MPNTIIKLITAELLDLRPGPVIAKASSTREKVLLHIDRRLKLLFHVNSVQKALPYFDNAIRQDFMYGIRCGCDQDFLKFFPEVTRCLSAYRDELITKLRSFLISSDGISGAQDTIAKYSGPLNQSALEFFRQAKAHVANAQIAHLVPVLKQAPVELENLRRDLEAARHKLAQRVSAHSLFDFPGNTMYAGWYYGFQALIVGALLSVAAYYATAFVLAVRADSDLRESMRRLDQVASML